MDGPCSPGSETAKLKRVLEFKMGVENKTQKSIFDLLWLTDAFLFKIQN